MANTSPHRSQGSVSRHAEVALLHGRRSKRFRSLHAAVKVDFGRCRDLHPFSPRIAVQSFPYLGRQAPLEHNRECALTTIARIVNRDQYSDALEGMRFGDTRHGLQVELANGWSIGGYTPASVAFADDPRTILSFRAGDKVQACPLARSYCTDDRGDWQAVIRIYDYAAKVSVTGKQSRCPQLSYQNTRSDGPVRALAKLGAFWRRGQATIY